MDAVLSALELDARDGVTIVSASQLAKAYYPQINPDLGALVLEIGSYGDGEQIHLALGRQYPKDHPVILLTAVDEPAQRLTLKQLGSTEKALALYIPPLGEPSSFEALQDTVAHLRAPEGCPWDQEQTHQSLRKHLLEEAYEALEALDESNMDDLREELGDLLLQITMHAQIAQEEGNFRMADVVADIQTKLIRRHPHVFGDVDVTDVDQVLSNWEHHKAIEKNSGPLDGVPKTLPALAQSAELQDRASRVGFKWPSIEEVISKVEEELGELKAEVGPQTQVQEVGDLLFSIVNYARWIDIDPEAALQQACGRFRARFERLLQTVSSSDRALDDMELTEIIKVWREISETRS